MPEAVDMRHRPPVVLIHGMWSQPTVWDRWQGKLEDAGYRCHRLRLFGHRPEAHPGTLERLGRTGLEEYVAQAREMVDSLHARPIVIGHSLGGLITQILATQTTLAAAVLVCSAAPAAVFPLRPVTLPGLMRHFLKPGLWRQPFRLSRAESDYLLFNAVPAEERFQLREGMVYESGRIAYEVGFGALNLRRTNAVDKGAVHCPILAVAGKKDRIVPVAVSRRLARWYGAALTYWEYPEHAHWPLAEPGWEEVVKRVIHWLPR